MTTWKFKQIKPQKCKGRFLESMWEDPAWSAENKEDGDRRIAQFCRAGPVREVRFTGTRESVDGTGYVEKSTNLPHLSDFPPQLEGTVLDGEIVAPWAKDLPGGESKYVTAVMGSLPERAVELQRKHGWLAYRVFDCLWYRGDDVRGETLDIRKHWLYEALQIWKNPSVTQMVAYTKESEKRRAWEMAKEGLVFKHVDHCYGDERGWVKLKKEATADVVMVGHKKGEGKYANTLGAIVFAQIVNGKLKELGACSGFDDAMRAAIYRRKTQYTGKVFRIKHNGREPTGAFRHPRFDCWRDDKSPKDCVYDPEET